MDGLMIPGQQDTGKGHCDEIGYERYICKKKKKENQHMEKWHIYYYVTVILSNIFPLKRITKGMGILKVFLL